jgi:hypothetical protein
MAFDQARILIERAEAFGEAPEDPLLLFSILYGVWAANFVAFNADALRELSAQFLTLAEKQTSSAPIMIGHRLVATSLAFTGNLIESRVHYDRALALYDRNEHRSLARDLARTSALSSCPFDRGFCGCLAIPRPLSPILRSQSRMHATSAMLRH